VQTRVNSMLQSLPTAKGSEFPPSLARHFAVLAATCSLMVGCSVVREVAHQRVEIQSPGSVSDILFIRSTAECGADPKVILASMYGINVLTNPFECFSHLSCDDHEFRAGPLGFIGGLLIGTVPDVGAMLNCSCDNLLQGQITDKSITIDVIDPDVWVWAQPQLSKTAARNSYFVEVERTVSVSVNDYLENRGDLTVSDATSNVLARAPAGEIYFAAEFVQKRVNNLAKSAATERWKAFEERWDSIATEKAELARAEADAIARRRRAGYETMYLACTVGVVRNDLDQWEVPSVINFVIDRAVGTVDGKEARISDTLIETEYALDTGLDTRVNMRVNPVTLRYRWEYVRKWWDKVDWVIYEGQCRRAQPQQ